MNILKTPQQKLLEEAGMMQPTPGLVKTPKQLLMEEVGVKQKLAKGKRVKKKLSVKDMEAELAANGKTPPRLKHGGKSKTKK